MEVINALGRRKTAVARIYVKAGSGNITINKRDYKEYFPTSILHYVVEQPLMLTETLGQFDIKVNLDGGGINGQAEAKCIMCNYCGLVIEKEPTRCLYGKVK